MPSITVRELRSSGKKYASVALFSVLWAMPQILVTVQLQQAHRTASEWTDLSWGDEASRTHQGCSQCSQRGWSTWKTFSILTPAKHVAQLSFSIGLSFLWCSQYKNLGFSQVGILPWGNLRNPNSYIDYTVNDPLKQFLDLLQKETGFDNRDKGNKWFKQISSYPKDFLK